MEEVNNALEAADTAIFDAQHELSLTEIPYTLYECDQARVNKALCEALSALTTAFRLLVEQEVNGSSK